MLGRPESREYAKCAERERVRPRGRLCTQKERESGLEAAWIPREESERPRSRVDRCESCERPRGRVYIPLLKAPRLLLRSRILIMKVCAKPS